MIEWQTQPAKEFCLSVRDGTHDSPKPVEIGRKLITSRHMISGSLDLDKAYLISAAEFEDINRRSKVDQWDVLISMIGTVGEVYLEQSNPDYAIKNIGLFKSRSERHGRWLYYYLRSPEARVELRRRCRGTTQLYVPLGELRAFPIRFPLDETEQDHIIEILGSLDDKIDLNRRMNETLEGTAQAIFRDWFVDFGPTRRKIDGASDPVTIMGGLVTDPDRAQELADLLPAAFGDDGLPVGWEERSLDQIAEFLNGLALQKFPAESQADSMPVIKIAELRNGLAAKSNRASRAVPAKYIVHDGDFLFSWSGSLLAKFWTEGEGALNQHLFKVSSEDFPPWFYSLWVQHHMEEFRQIAASKATTMGHIQRGHLKSAMTVCPPPDVIDVMTRCLGPVIERTVHNDLENRTLAATRDLLLPKLMSGEIRLREAEEIAEAAQ